MLRLLFLMFSLAGTIAYSQAQVPKEKTLLWELSGKGIRQPSFLFGTIHIMCPEDLKVAEIIRKKFSGARQLYLEIDMDDPGMITEMMTGMKMKDSSIDQLMNEETYDTLSKLFLKQTGFPLGMLKNMKPLMLMSLLYPAILNCQPESWEKTFQDMAKEKNIAIHGLEKLEDQIDVLEKFPYRVQAEMLLKTMLNPDSTRNSFNEMLQIYKTKDINKLNEMTTSDKDFGDYEEALLNDRNRKWVPVFIKQATTMPTFFAFGAGHLGGKHGIINLLRSKGYTIKPIMY